MISRRTSPPPPGYRSLGLVNPSFFVIQIFFRNGNLTASAATTIPKKRAVKWCTGGKLWRACPEGLKFEEQFQSVLGLKVNLGIIDLPLYTV